MTILQLTTARANRAVVGLKTLNLIDRTTNVVTHSALARIRARGFRN